MVKFNPHKIKEKLHSKGYRLTWVADKVGITRQYLHMIFSETRTPSKLVQKQLQELAK